MAATVSEQRVPAISWRTAGLWMVVLALGLAVFGIVLALQQAQSLTNRMMAQAELRARSIAVTVRDLFFEQLDASLGRVANDACLPSDARRRRTDAMPRWIDGIYRWDGSRLTTWREPAVAQAGFDDLLISLLTAANASPPHDSVDHQTQLLNAQLDGAPVLIGCLETFDAADRPAVVAARVLPERLMELLVEPLLTAHSGLELVPVVEAQGPWAHPLPSALQLWALQPTESFVREHRQIIVGRTMAYLGLTVLALGTLLATMWFLLRVVQREIALAAMKANFVADVSHELKTPLATIRLFCETLQSGRVTSEEKRDEYYTIITRESNRLTNLIDNILDFSRIEAGRKDYEMHPTNVAEVVEEIYNTYRVELDHKGFEHHLRVDTDLPSVEADRDAIAQAVLNLMSNAVKYSGQERYLAVEVGADTRRGRKGVLISIHDHGIGVRPEDRAHLFDGFYRSPDEQVRQRRGTGLGLALVKHIVDAHHGSLDVESRLVKGSTFRVFLPGSASPRRIEPMPSEDSGSGERAAGAA